MEKLATRCARYRAERDCARQDAARMRREVEGMRDRLMPEDMEWLVEAWPRFEDDVPVRFLDDFERYGEENGVSAVTMYSDGSFALNCRAYSKGEHVNHPAPKALDADGVEIRVGDTVWHVETGEQCKVVEVDSRSVSVDFRADGDGTKHTGSALPVNLTHRAPVLAADGLPLREGETVYHANSGIEYSVRSVTTGGAHLSKGSKPGGYCRAEYLTHERPDNWGRWREEWQWPPVKYCRLILGVEYDHDAQLQEAFDAQGEDLVRRAKALAEREK